MSDPVVSSGTCHAVFAYDVGHWVRLDEAAAFVDGWTHGLQGGEPRPPARYLDFKHPPLRARARAEPIGVGSTATTPEVEAVIFDFGVVSLSYQIPLGGPLSSLAPLSSALYENEALLMASRQEAGRLLEVLASAVDRPRVGRFAEDYAIFQIDALEGHAPEEVAEIVEENQETLARILRSESRPLSRQEVEDALRPRMAYTAGDEAIVDWNAAVLFFHDHAPDVRTVLEYANVQLLEMRWLDDQLDQVLDRSYEVLARRREARRLRRSFPLVPYREIHRVAQLQTDSAVLFEGVTNALKLVGDQYLARLYRLAAQRMRLPEWDASVTRKLHTVESIYQKLSDQASTLRLEVLEWIIIALIAVSILLAL